MIFENNNGSGKPRDPDAEFKSTLSFLYMILILAAAAVIYKNKDAIFNFYVENFAYIWTPVALGLMTGLGVILHRYRKKNDQFLDRCRRLKHAWTKQHGSVLAGSIQDDGTELYVSEQSRTGHVQIIGATGRGKTESVIVPWAVNDFAHGISTVIIDGKGDWSLPVTLGDAIGAESERLLVFDLSHVESSICTNPLHQGSAQQITDRIFASFEFGDPYYRELQYSVCLDLVALLKEILSEGVTFKRLFALIDSDEALTEAVANSKNDELVRRLTNHLREPKQKRDEKLSGLSSQLRPLATGELADLVNGPSDGNKYKNLSDVVLSEDGEARVLCILLPTLLYQKAAKALGKLFLQELAWCIGRRGSKDYTGGRPFLSVFLDEFSSFAYRGFEQILNKARSANVALHLSHQSLGDLEAVGMDFATIVNTNTNIKCVLGVNDPRTADFFASHLGTTKSEKMTEQAIDEGTWIKRQRKTGEKSLREVDIFKVHPNDLKEFNCGTGVLHMQTPDGPITEVINFYRLCDVQGGADD